MLGPVPLFTAEQIPAPLLQNPTPAPLCPKNLGPCPVFCHQAVSPSPNSTTCTLTPGLDFSNPALHSFQSEVPLWDWAAVVRMVFLTAGS